MGERRSCSSIDSLPESVRNQLDIRLMDRTYSYQSDLEWLWEEGYKISYGALWRYAQRGREAAKRLSDTLQRTQALAAAVEAHPNLDYTKAANVLLMDGLVQKVASAEDEFLEMPLDKAGRLIAALSRNATYEQRVRAELKKKAELAFDELQADLMSQIKQYPELAEPLRDILARAREKVVDANAED